MNTKIIEDIQKRQNELNSSTRDMINSLARDVLYNKDGSINKAPLFSKRGHVAETLHAYSLYQNIISGCGNFENAGIATDRVAINRDTLPVNDQYKDIIVEDIKNKIHESYQSKICSTAEKSMEAATAEKYLKNNITPLVPSDQNKYFGNISFNDGGKKFKSDNYSLDFLNDITRKLEQGESTPVLNDNKMERLHYHVLNRACSDGAKAAFLSASIDELMDVVKNNQNNQKTFLQRAGHVIAGTLDGLTRNAFVTEAAFSSNNKQLASSIAEVAYDSAKGLWNKMFSKERTTYSNHDSLSENVRNIGSAFGSFGGPIGKAIGGVIGDSICSFAKKAAISTVMPVAAKAIGRTLGTFGGCAASIGAKIKAISVSSTVSAIGKGFAIGAKCLAGVGIIGLLASVLFGDDEEENKTSTLVQHIEPTIAEEIFEKKQEIKSIASMYYKEIDNIYDYYNEVLPYAASENLKEVIISSVKFDYIRKLNYIDDKIHKETQCFFDSVEESQRRFSSYVGDADAFNKSISNFLECGGLNRLSIKNMVKSLDLYNENEKTFISKSMILRAME